MAYSPTLMRWMQADPTGAQYVDGPNLNQFVQGNPVTMVDPSGLETTQPTTSPRDVLWKLSADKFDAVVIMTGKDPDGKVWTDGMEKLQKLRPEVSHFQADDVGALVTGLVKAHQAKAKRLNKKPEEVKLNVVLVSHAGKQGPGFGHGADFKPLIDEWTPHQIADESDAEFELKGHKLFDLKGIIGELTFTGCAAAGDQTGTLVLDALAKGLGAFVRAFKFDTVSRVEPGSAKYIGEVISNPYITKVVGGKIVDVTGNLKEEPHQPRNLGEFVYETDGRVLKVR